MYQKIGSKLYILVIILIIANIFAYKNLSEKKEDFEKTIKSVELSVNNGDLEDAIRTLEAKEYKNKNAKAKLNSLKYKLLDEYIESDDYKNQIIVANKLIQSNPSDEKLKNVLQTAKAEFEKQEKIEKEQEEKRKKEQKAEEELKSKYEKILSQNNNTISKNLGSYTLEIYENSNKKDSYFVIHKDNSSGLVTKISNIKYPETYKPSEGDFLEMLVTRFDPNSNEYYLVLTMKGKTYYNDYNDFSKVKHSYYKIEKNTIIFANITNDIQYDFKKNTSGGYTMTSPAWDSPVEYDNRFGNALKRKHRVWELVEMPDDYHKYVYEVIGNDGEDLLDSIRIYGEYKFLNNKFVLTSLDVYPDFNSSDF